MAKEGSLKNIWLNCSLWNQKSFFYGITWRTFWSTFIFKSALLSPDCSHWKKVTFVFLLPSTTFTLCCKVPQECRPLPKSYSNSYIMCLHLLPKHTPPDFTSMSLIIPVKHHGLSWGFLNIHNWDLKTNSRWRTKVSQSFSSASENVECDSHISIGPL